MILIMQLIALILIYLYLKGQEGHNIFIKVLCVLLTTHLQSPVSKSAYPRPLLRGHLLNGIHRLC